MKIITIRSEYYGRLNQPVWEDLELSVPDEVYEHQFWAKHGDFGRQLLFREHGGEWRKILPSDGITVFWYHGPEADPEADW